MVEKKSKKSNNNGLTFVFDYDNNYKNSENRDYVKIEGKCDGNGGVEFIIPSKNQFIEDVKNGKYKIYNNSRDGKKINN